MNKFVVIETVTDSVIGNGNSIEECEAIVRSGVKHGELDAGDTLIAEIVRVGHNVVTPVFTEPGVLPPADG